MASDDEISRLVSKAAIQSGRRYDISGATDFEVLTMLAAQAAMYELDNIAKALTSRSSDIRKELIGMARSMVVQKMGQEWPEGEVGIQIDWLDKTLDVFTKTDIINSIRKGESNERAT